MPRISPKSNSAANSSILRRLIALSSLNLFFQSCQDSLYEISNLLLFAISHAMYFFEDFSIADELFLDVFQKSSQTQNKMYM